MSAESKLAAAFTSLVLEQPFWGSLALHFTGKYRVADPTCKTAWVDGVRFGYNPKFIESLPHERIKATVAHEVSHCALGHPWRRDGREMKQWNIACDKTINTQLRDAGYTLPDGVYYATGDEIGMSAEWIYGRQQDQQAKQQQEQAQQEKEEQESQDDSSQDDEKDDDTEGDEQQDDADDGEGDQEGDQEGEGEGQSDQDGQQDGDGQGDGDGQQDGQQGDQDGSGGGAGDGEGDPLGEVRDAPTGPDVDGNLPPSEQEWKERVVTAMTQAKMMGKMPGGFARMVEESLKAPVDIRSLLLRFFSERSSNDYTWTRPSTRYIAQGHYLPAMQDHTLGEIALYVDTSGSMDDVALRYARGIVESVIEECSPSAVTLWMADAEVARVTRFEKGEPLEWNPDGGGGTDFRPCLDAIEKEGTAVCAVCITDLDGTFPETPLSIPVLWLVPKSPWTREDQVAPFGETVHFDR